MRELHVTPYTIYLCIARRQKTFIVVEDDIQNRGAVTFQLACCHFIPNRILAYVQEVYRLVFASTHYVK